MIVQNVHYSTFTCAFLQLLIWLITECKNFVKSFRNEVFHLRCNTFTGVWTGNMSYPPYGGGGYPPQGGYPQQQPQGYGGYPPQGGYPGQVFLFFN